MSKPSEDNLSQALTELTEWRSGDTALWREALERSRAAPAKPAGRIVRWPFLGALAATVAVAAAGIVAMRVSQSRERSSTTAQYAASVGRAWSNIQEPISADLFGQKTAPEEVRGLHQGSVGWSPRGAPLGDIPLLSDAFAGPGYEVWSTGSDGADRAILRDSSMSLTVDDVRVAFAAASSLVDTLAGEFVESAVLNGEGEAAHASVSLRISADRLDTVMQTARRLGEVTHEQTNASDVADRLADLGAQVRNERRIEAELLGLLDSRPEAPLADILKVRQSLDEVRLKIERLEAQRAGLGKRVALSLLRIQIASKAKEEPEPEPAGASFLGMMRDAFGRGGDALGASIAWMVEVAIGGLAVWLPMLVIGFWIYRSLRWRATWT